MPNILDTLDVIENLSSIYESDRAFGILKDFERVLDELGIYVYENWEDGELVSGPTIERHWVTCGFMWAKNKMPDPNGGKRLLDYDCKVEYEKSTILKPRRIKDPSDIRPGTKKGKLDRIPIWVVKIQMPKKLIVDIYGGDFKDIDLPERETQQAVAPAVAGALPPPVPVAGVAAPPITGAAPVPGAV